MTLYYLVAGRWFSASDFTGPWTFATPKLPPDFQKIPLEHPRSRVLASVPGTRQAAEAILVAQIPETARVNIKTLKAPEVSYQGDPKFESEPGTKVESAVNTRYLQVQRPVLHATTASVLPKVRTDPGSRANIPKKLYEIPSELFTTTSPVTVKTTTTATVGDVAVVAATRE
jgi:hypothetical protein